jgi:LmbE family N-acetylglucosaminyl deacetylase
MEQLRIIVFGAHPDDCDIGAGGVAALWARGGHHVKFVSVTNGDAGHQTLAGAALANLRRSEAQAAAQVLGIEYEVLDNHDGELLPTLENRRQIIKLIREFRPHLVLGHRPNDYHPDHRYTATLVQDAAYMVTVPNVVAAVPHLERNPIFMYTADGFQKPYPFTPDVIVDIDSVIETKIEALACHESQFFEWLPYNGGYLQGMPEESEARGEWFSSRMKKRLSRDATRFRDELIESYGNERGSQIQFAEAFEWCEYGAALTDEMREKLFTF